MDTNKTPAAVTIANATIYSVGDELAYQIEYSEGTKVRAVVSRNGWIRKEWDAAGTWVLVGKPYTVKAAGKRDAERIRAAVIEFLK